MFLCLSLQILDRSLLKVGELQGLFCHELTSNISMRSDSGSESVRIDSEQNLMGLEEFVTKEAL